MGVVNFNVFFTAVPYGPCAGEIVFSRKNPVLGILKKVPCWKRLFFSENFHMGKIISLCVGPVLWCVGTLKFSKVPLYVGPVLAMLEPCLVAKVTINLKA